MKEQTVYITPEGEVSQRRCNLPDDELLTRCGDWINKLCKSGGRDWCLQVPVNFDRDPDMLFIELINRYREQVCSRHEYEHTIRELIERLEKYREYNERNGMATF